MSELGDKIRALTTDEDGEWANGFSAALDRAAALADEHAATIATAYEAAAVWIEGQAAGSIQKSVADALRVGAIYIRALTPADARAALDRIKAEARKKGLKWND